MGDQPVTIIATLTATLNGITADAKALTDQMVALTAKIDNININNRNNNIRNNRNYNNNKNQSGGGEPIPVIRVRNNSPTTVTYL